MIKKSVSIIKKIKQKDWYDVVRRTGFLQSKLIIIDAETQFLEITKGVKVKCNNQLWVKEINLYEKTMWDGIGNTLGRAFEKDKKWPKKIIVKFNKFEILMNGLIKEMNVLKQSKIDSRKKRLTIFNKYVKLLKEIQKYYIIASPLANFCEAELNILDKSLAKYATSFKKLDIDLMNESLRIIKKSKDRKDLIKKHVEKFAWIKTAYNIIDEYTEDDVKKELKSINFSKKKNNKGVVGKKYKYLLDGLRIGIYMRNRMKELSQQAWYYFEPIGQNMAKELNIKRDDFFQLSYEEIISSYKIGHCVVSSKNINNRKKGFILGKVDNKKIIIDNQKNVNNVYDYFDKIKIDDVKEFSGSSASRGKISGEIKIIINKKDFRKFKKGKILVTTMTTPDYVVLMKQASAIITNEGGLSCHAAIVARELGKPCIIGTKFATQVLHDGDSVEVDANKGNC